MNVSDGSAADSPHTGKSVIVADDSPIQRTVLSVHLKKMGFAVTGAEDGQQAIESARQARPDAIVSDITMPGVGGYELCRLIRADPDLRAVPVILNSASEVEDADRRQAKEAGADAIVHRAPGFEEITEALLTSLGARGGNP